DFVEPKPNAPAPPANGPTSAGGSGPTSPTEKKGMHAIAKGDDQTQVKKVYYRVRKLAEVAEQGGESEFHQFIKDMRKELKNLELAVGRRLLPAGAAGTAPVTDDAPTAPGKAGPEKGVPGKGPALPGNATAAGEE